MYMLAVGFVSEESGKSSQLPFSKPDCCSEIGGMGLPLHVEVGLDCVQKINNQLLQQLHDLMVRK